MAYNSLNRKVEEACKAVVDNIGLVGVIVNAGGTQSEMASPYVTCACPGGGSEVENLHGTGWKIMEAQIMTAGSLDDLADMDTHAARVKQVHDAFMDEDINTNLKTLRSAAVGDSEFTVMDVEFTSEDQEIEERKVTNTLAMEIVCCASDIT